MSLLTTTEERFSFRSQELLGYVPGDTLQTKVIYQVILGHYVLHDQTRHGSHGSLIFDLNKSSRVSAQVSALPDRPGNVGSSAAKAVRPLGLGEGASSTRALPTKERRVVRSEKNDKSWPKDPGPRKLIPELIHSLEGSAGK